MKRISIHVYWGYSQESDCESSVGSPDPASLAMCVDTGTDLTIGSKQLYNRMEEANSNESKMSPSVSATSHLNGANVSHYAKQGNNEPAGFQTCLTPVNDYHNIKPHERLWVQYNNHTESTAFVPDQKPNDIQLFRTCYGYWTRVLTQLALDRCRVTMLPKPRLLTFSEDITVTQIRAVFVLGPITVYGTDEN
ncbi:hypothetical protein NQ317_001029 [Molorchus minor]|uniref:Peptidase A2 domain-containing protein n=1 Tax=Molorchus minor TaxID=1323400 RepID=A0ABQ9JFQ3_9CUCU|nr:hypothetical protein NQ317_001029 [Molorchus minor]